MSIGMVIFGSAVALWSIVAIFLPSIMSDHTQDSLLFSVVAAPLVLIVGFMVATNIELKKLDKDETQEIL